MPQLAQTRTASAYPSVGIGGTSIQRLDRFELVDHIFASLAEQRGGSVITVNVHHLFNLSRDQELRELYARASVRVADGMPLVWASRIQNRPLPERVTGADLVWILAERAAREGRSIYLLGGAPGAAASAQERLAERWPSLRLGWSSPNISPRATPAQLALLCDELKLFRPDLVYVALGAPKAEFLIDAIRPTFPETWLLGVGISFSYMSQLVPRAPQWMQRVGLEWLHRLSHEPRRLWRRYLKDDLGFAARLMLEAARERRRTPPDPE